MSTSINGNQTTEGIVLNIQPSNIKGMEPFMLKDSIEKISKILDLGIDSFNPNCITVNRGAATLTTVLSDNAIIVVESEEYICLGNFHKKQMRLYSSKIFKKIFEFFDCSGQLKVTIFMNDDTWNINTFCSSLFKNLKNIYHYEIKGADPGSKITVY